MNKILNYYTFPNAYRSLISNSEERTKLEINCIYLDGFDRKIKIYNSIAWEGVIFYVGKYIDQDTNEIIKDMNKNAECKFLKDGQHFLYHEKKYNLIKEVI